MPTFSIHAMNVSTPIAAPRGPPTATSSVTIFRAVVVSRSLTTRCHSTTSDERSSAMVPNPAPAPKVASERMGDIRYHEFAVRSGLSQTRHMRSCLCLMNIPEACLPGAAVGSGGSTPLGTRPPFLAASRRVKLITL